ncbi:MAG: DUF4097 family beta strand repeat protein [Acidobacteria bacterium]|nr:DUF4097 family beta strand repeat protein [Acidobacteriota bacterium]
MKREESFEVGGRAELVVVVASSDVVLTAGEAGRIDVLLEGDEAALDRFDITHAGDLVSIRLRKEGGRRWFQSGVSITVALPPGSDVDLKTASGNIYGSVDTGTLLVATASGDVRFGAVSRRAKIKSASGDVSIGEVAGDLDWISASGDIRVDAVSGDLSISTASGDLSVGEAGGRTVAKSASGDTHIGLFSGPSLNVVSMSGDVVVGLAPGMSVEANISTLSGSLHNNVTPSDAEPTKRATLRIKTMSGDIVLR